MIWADAGWRCSAFITRHTDVPLIGILVIIVTASKLEAIQALLV